MGFEPEIHPTYFMFIVFASSFRLLITFALVLEVHGIWKKDIPRTSRTTVKVTNNLRELAITINMK